MEEPRTKYERNVGPLIIFVLIIAIFIGGCLEQRQGPTSPEFETPTTEFESPFNLFFQVTPRTSEEDLRFAAENAKLIRAANVIKGGLPPDRLRFIKEINPDIHISIYHSLPEIKRVDPLLESGFYDEHEDWLLHCENNSTRRVIFSPEKYKVNFADISNQEYRNFWINRTRRAIQNKPPVIDVIFIDVAAAKHPLRQFSCEPENYTHDWWEKEVGEFLQEIKDAFPDKVVIANSIKLGYWKEGEEDGGKFVGLQYANYVDGLAAERWVHVWGSYRGEEFWKALLNAYIPLLRQGKWIAVVQHPEKFGNDDQRRMFGFASYLLIRSETFGFIEEDDPTKVEQIQKHPVFYIPLGEPKEELKDRADYYLYNGVYKREYENGLVLVNPSETKTKTYVLQKEMYLVILKGKTIEYKMVKEVTLPPISGAILIRELRKDSR